MDREEPRQGAFEAAHAPHRRLRRSALATFAATTMACVCPAGPAAAQDALDFSFDAGEAVWSDLPDYVMEGLDGSGQGFADRAVFGLDKVIIEEANERLLGVVPPVLAGEEFGQIDVPAAILALSNEGLARAAARPDRGWGSLLDPQDVAFSDWAAMATLDPEVLARILDLAPYMLVGGEVGVRVLVRDQPESQAAGSGLTPCDAPSRWPQEGCLGLVAPSDPTATPATTPTGGPCDLASSFPQPGCLVEVRAGGAIARLEHPLVFDWNGGLTGDLSCFRPREVDLQAVAGQVNAVRVQSVLIAGMGGVLRSRDGQVSALGPPRCSEDVMASGVLHCSGLIEPDGLTVWTAAHCVLSDELNFLDGLTAGLGQSLPCPAGARLRIVSLLGLTRDDMIVPEALIRPCARVDVVGPDVVKVTLASPLEVPPADGQSIAPWRLPLEGELDDLLVDGRRLYGTGFMQGIDFFEMRGGRVVRMEHCLAALAFSLGRVPRGLGAEEEAEAVRAAMEQLRAEVPAQTVTHQGFGCTTMDTTAGTSGGPVLALADDGASLVLVGLISAAAWIDLRLECRAADEPILQDGCATGPSGPERGMFNLFAIRPG